ncbi:MAG: glycosyltransferase family 2 protein [Elusimicrobia bacterium]|nr:glycosyltransferase family 2 protein [Elusimicrobiota bacterium]
MTTQTVKLSVSVLIMTQNEEVNIRYAVESVLPYFNQVIVADSFSTDNTLAILKEYPEVEVYQHVFESWAEQRNWMLANCAIRNETVFFLDADEYIDGRLVKELGGVLQSGAEFSAIYLDREYVFLGGTLKYAHGHPLTFRVFKKEGLSFVGEGAREYAKVNGPAITFKSPYIHHDRNPVSVWIRKHNNNSDREAELFISREKRKDVLPVARLSGAQRSKLWVRANLWNKFPLLSRPFLYFPARYILTLGFLEGVPAFIYIYLNAFFYQSLIDAKVLYRKACATDEGPVGASSVPDTDKLPVTVLIMAQNEQENIRYAVESVLPYFNQIIVADSFSTDRTTEILKEYPGVEVYQNTFESWADQRNWMLANCAIRNEKVLFLDADEYITPEFAQEFRQILDSGVNFASIIIKPCFIFMGRQLRYAYGHPKIKRIFSRAVRFFGVGAREYAVLSGACLEIISPIMHRDHKPLFAWVAKHNNNSDREAAAYFERKIFPGEADGGLAGGIKAKLWVRGNIWDKLPLLARPFFYFIYRYFFKLGFMDGKPGFIYCFLHSFLYQSMIDVKIIETRKKKV